jgi:hypothetical protein
MDEEAIVKTLESNLTTRRGSMRSVPSARAVSPLVNDCESSAAVGHPLPERPLT